MTLRVLDLFSGIGGFSLGLERAGMQTVAFCEINPFCRRVLAKHWPEVPIYEDVRTLSAQHLTAAGISVDVICGGFPCQDISVAGKGAGLAGERSGLWSEYARLIGEIRPRYVIVENVAALLGRGLADVLGDLAAIGYDAEWHCIPASAIGAPHQRDRIWIVADDAQWRRGNKRAQGAREGNPIRWPQGTTGGLCGDVAHSAWNVQSQQASSGTEWERARPSGQSQLGDANSTRLAQRQGIGGDARPQLTSVERTNWWLSEPDVGRVANGIPARVDRLRSLGNAVVPQIPEMIGRAIMETVRNG